MMLALLRKDWRLNRVVVLAALVMSTLPYALSITNLWVNPPPRVYSPPDRPLEPQDYFDAVVTAAYAAVVLSVVLAAAFGGVAFAAERRERTAEFMAVLPASRLAIIASKLLVAAACIAVLVAFHLSMLVWSASWSNRYGTSRPNDWADLLRAIGLTSAFAVALFGVAWGLSVYLRSPAISASISIVVAFGLMFGGTVWLERAAKAWDAMNGTTTAQSTGPVLLAIFVATVGLLAIVGPSLHYLRRVEP